MNWKKVAITGAILFVIGFLLGFIPQYQKASKLTAELDSARLGGELSQIREKAALSYVDASRMNYGSAAEDSERMFGLATQLANDTKDAALRSSLQGLLTLRDTVEGKLKAADSSVLQPLQQIVQKSQTELKRS